MGRSQQPPAGALAEPRRARPVLWTSLAGRRANHGIVLCGAGGTPFESPIFWAGVLGWMGASILKILIHWHRTRHVDLGCLTSLGGMPSAHSAMVSALATSVGLSEGFGSTVFVLALFFALVVMLDASTVRRAAGFQARLLNQVVEVLLKEHHLPTQKLREMLGHTRMEVLAGMLMGVAIALGISLLPY